MQILSRAAAALSAVVFVALGTGCSSNNATPLTTATTIPVPVSTAGSSMPVGPTSWNVAAGDSTGNEAYQELRFYPSTITIDAGDSVQWTFAALEPHTVSFPINGTSPVPASDPSVGAPAGGTTEDGSAYNSSGFLLGGATYSLTFPKAGTYTYYSLIHQPEAVGTIVVQAAGTAYPATQSAYDSAAASQESTDYAAAAAAISTFPFMPGGSHVSAGIAPGLAAGAPANSTVMRFLNGISVGSNITNVAVGTTVTWTNESNNVPHDVVFPVAGGTVPTMLGPFDPASGPSSYDGSTLTDSGVIPPGGSYSLTFTKAGTYSYECLFHNMEGMLGSMVVH